MRILSIPLSFLLVLPVCGFAKQELPEMTEAVLRHCVSIDIDLDQEKRELTRLGQQTRSSEYRLDVSARHFRSAQGRLDRSDPEARAALEQQRIEHNAQIEAHNELAARYNAIRDRHNELADRFNADCLRQLRTGQDWLDERYRQVRERQARQQGD